MSTLTRGFDPRADRYQYDQQHRARTGWVQVDTRQDASYFGVWTNPIERKIFTYCEGDTTLEQCDSDLDYAEALNRCLEFYDSDQQRAMIDCVLDGRTHPEIVNRLHVLGFRNRMH